jgi:hypothetical protein
MKLITHLDPSQLRLGYLICLSLVAGRQLDTRQGLVDRLMRFLFQAVDEHDPRWATFMQLADADELKRVTPTLDDKAAALQELFRVTSPQSPSYPLHALWLAQQSLPSHLGGLAIKNTDRLLEMGRSFELLTTGYALSEKGVFLQQFSAHALPGVEGGEPSANPFDIRVRPALWLFFLYTLLTVDIFSPFLLQEFVGHPDGDLPNAPKLITKAAAALVAVLEGQSDITNIEHIRACRNYAERLHAKGVAKNQAQPRYHHLFELQLLDRVESEIGGRRIVPYRANHAAKIADSVLQPLRNQPFEQQDLLDLHFFRWASSIFERSHRRCDDDRQRLMFFARGFEYLQREIGFTPGRTIALAGCLLAWEQGWIVEVAEMFDLLRRMAAGPWRPYLEYSGGSRLDQEFLIKIKPGLIPALESSLAQDHTATPIIPRGDAKDHGEE